MTSYSTSKIFSNVEKENLKLLWEKQEAKFAHQDYNLFNVEKRHVRSETYTKEIHRLNATAGLKSLGHYFVKYTEGSFTRLHSDNADAVGKTIVTLVDTHQLVGGETLMFDVYPRQPRPSDRYAKRTSEDNSYDKDIIPVVVPLEDGDSVIYNHEVRHGVCKIHSGYRIVLVSWYGNDNIT